MKLDNAKIHERSRNNEAVRIQKRNNKIIFFLLSGIVSYALFKLVFKEDGKVFVNPFDPEYLASNWYISLGLVSTTIVVYLFHFGNTKRKYLHKLEFLKQKIFNFMDIYISGDDKRNLYFRFGLEYSLKNNFLMRKISRKDYIEKLPIDRLKVFTKECSPHAFFKVGDKHLDISKYFHSDKDYLELFQIIEGYLSKNVDIFQNAPLNKFQAIGTYNPKFTKESFEYFLNIAKVQDSRIIKRSRNTFNEIMSNSKLSNKQKQLKIKALIEKNFNGENGFNDYKIAIYSMVVFSAQALQEFLENIYNEAKNFYLKAKIHNFKVYKNMISYGDIDNEELEKLLEYIVFCYFYKVINYYMGLPSGIVTARIKDYSFARVMDDLEHFEMSSGIRLIKKRENDKDSKFNDTFARTFMILYHEYRANSENRAYVEKVISRFNPLLSTEVMNNLALTTPPKEFGENKTSILALSDSLLTDKEANFGTRPDDDYVPTFYDLQKRAEQLENESKEQ